MESSQEPRRYVPTSEQDQRPAGRCTSALGPRAALAVMGASDSTSTPLDLNTIITTAEERGMRNTWAETSPGSMLLLPHDSSVGAVADVMNVIHDQAAGTITLELDIVDSPHTISEFEPHAKQSLDQHESHYHFMTAPGVKVDAASFVSTLKDDALYVAGLHIFVKGDDGGDPPPPCANCCRVPVAECQEGFTTYQITEFRAEPTTAEINQLVSITAQVQGWTEENGYVVLVLFGNAVWGISNTRSPGYGNKTSSKRFIPAGKSGKGSRQAPDVIESFMDSNGLVEAQLQVTGPGPITVTLPWLDTISGEDEGIVTDVAPIVINAADTSVPPTNCTTPPTVSKLVLLPHKAYRRVHDDITLTAITLGADHQPLAGVQVAFAVEGDCEPKANTATSTTNAAGEAFVHIVAQKPGAITVRAAAAGAAGAVVLSESVSVFYFHNHHDVEHRERRYWDGDAAAYEKAATTVLLKQLALTPTAAHS